MLILIKVGSNTDRVWMEITVNYVRLFYTKYHNQVLNITLHIFIVYILVLQGHLLTASYTAKPLPPFSHPCFSRTQFNPVHVSGGTICLLYQQVLCLPEGIPLKDES